MRNHNLLAIVLMVATAACSEPAAPTEPLVFAPLPPDTGNLGASFVEGPSIVTIVDDSALHDSTLMVALKRRREGSDVAVRVARMEPVADSVLKIDNVLAVGVSPSRRLAFRGRLRTVSGSGYISWVGELQGGPVGTVQLTRSPDGRMYGNVYVQLPTRDVYFFESFANGFGFVTRTDYRKPMID